jgi:hypothetical protein
MKRLTLILLTMLMLFGCKKEIKCLIGGKWYHEKTVINGATTSENSGFWVEFNEDGNIYDSNGGKYEYVATDERINELKYQCKGKSLKVEFGGFNQTDIVFTDFDKNYTQYKR